MKFIKGIILTLVVLVALVAIVGFLSPSHVHIERSIIVNAPTGIIHGQINDLKNWTKWSPWHKMDTTMKIEYNPIDTGIGASYKWFSKNKKVGSGEMTITASNKDSISTAMDFTGSGIATAHFIFSRLSDKKDSVPEKTKVIWTMDMDMGMNPIGRIIGLFMDKMLGPDFENGLHALKQLAESIPTGPKTYRGFQVAEEDTPDRIYIMKKDSAPFNEIEKYYNTNLPILLKALNKSKLKADGAPSCLYFKWDSASKTAIMAVAIPVKNNINTRIKGYETMSVPAGKDLHIVYHGGYKKIGDAHYAMNEYMKEKNLIWESPIIEEYVTGPQQEIDSSKWITNVYYRVK